MSYLSINCQPHVGDYNKAKAMDVDNKRKFNTNYMKDFNFLYIMNIKRKKMYLGQFNMPLSLNCLSFSPLF